MIDIPGWPAVGIVADIATIAATLLAFAGAFSALRSGARVMVDATARVRSEIAIHVRHVKGSSPAKNVNIDYRFFELDGRLIMADGRFVAAALFAGRTFTLALVNPESVRIADSDEYRSLPLDSTGVLPCVVAVSWQHPILPWKRSLSVARWDVSQHNAGLQPTVFHGRSARRIWRTEIEELHPRS